MTRPTGQWRLFLEIVLTTLFERNKSREQEVRDAAGPPLPAYFIAASTGRGDLLRGGGDADMIPDNQRNAGIYRLPCKGGVPPHARISGIWGKGRLATDVNVACALDAAPFRYRGILNGTRKWNGQFKGRQRLADNK